MNITTTTTTTTASNTTTNTIKTPEPETETPSRILHTKPVSITNGVLKRHQPLNQHHHHHHHPNVPILVIYKECLKNHAASLGGHALDGCGEFMPSPSATPTDPTSLKCAACGCHRNFHRREPEDPLTPPNNAVVEFQPHHRHHPPPPRGGDSSPNSPSPPPISSAYYPASAPHLLLALSGGLSGPKPENNPTSGNGSAPIAGHPRGRKRFRTKFTQNQKDRMFAFAERVGWKIQRSDEGAIAELCSEIGVDRGVLKVWMHNNKSTLGTKREITIPNINGDNIDGAHENNKNNIASSGSQENLGQHSGSGSPHNVVCTIGNSSSSS